LANQFKLLVGSSALAAMLAACGGGGSSSTPASNTSDAATRALPPEIAEIIDEQNELTDALCPDASGDAGDGGSMDPDECLTEGEEGSEDDTGFELSQDMIVQQFCPDAAVAFDPAGLFDPAMLQEDPQTALTGFFEQSGTFAAACLQEAAGNLQNAGDLLGGSNPITEAICPEESMDGTVDPANCFAEAAAGGNLPGGGDGGDGAADPIAEQLCPETGSIAPNPASPTACLDEASRVYITIIDMITAPNPLTEQICPQDAADGRVNPPDCFAEATMGIGGFPGDPGGGDGSNPFAPVLEQFCPDTAAAPIGPTTPVDCLAEAGGDFDDVQDLLLGPNPLTENLCPEAAQTTPIDPAACFMEVGGGGLPGGGGGDNPLAPVLEQFCPETAAGEVGPTTPIDCLTEAGSAFGDVQDLISGSNPLTEQLCPEESADGTVDPAACFEEAAGGAGGLPGGGGDNPLAPVLEQFCPETAENEVSPTTPVDCLAEAGGNFQDVQDLLLGPNPLTENLCPEAAQTTPIDPAACFEEAAGGAGGLPGGGGDNPLAPVLEQFCPETAAGEVGPTTPIDCLTEAGSAFGDVQDLISGSNPLTEALCPEESADGTVDPAACFEEAAGGAGGLPGGGGDNPLAPVLEQFCPETAENEVGPTTPVDCLAEAGGNFQDVQDLLLGSNPLTEQLCPEASADAPIDPAACFMEAAGGLAPGGGELPGADGNPLAPVLAQFCPDTSEADLGPTTPIDCLTEAGGNFGDVQDLLLGSNPLTEQLCPEASADAPIDPAACFMEAAGGLAPGGGELPGADGNPLEPVLAQFCPDTSEADLGPTTPLDCLIEAGGNFGDVQDLLLGSNPLTEQLCPEASADSPIDPAACFMEAAGGLAPGGGELPGADGNPLAPVLAQFCPDTSEADLGPTTPLDCLTEAGGNFGDVQELLLGSNPLTEQLCPEASADSPIDPAACFEEAAGGFAPGGGGLPGADGNPLAPVLGQFCPDASEADLGPTTPFDCLIEAGSAFGDIQDAISGSNPLTDQICSEESADGNVDPAACFMEAISGGAGGDGTPLDPILDGICPDAAAGGLSPTLAFECLLEGGSGLAGLFGG